MKASFLILYKFLSLSSFEKTLDSWALKASLRDDVNDPLENIPMFHKSNHAQAFSEGMVTWDIPPFFSFTRCMSVPAMWGHYAGNAKGICMVFLFPIRPHALGSETDIHPYSDGFLDKSVLYGCNLDDIIEDTTFLTMKYDQNRIPANSVYQDTDKGHRLIMNHDLMRTKATCWSYEHEVRIICDIKHANLIKDNMLLYSWPMRFFAGAIRGPKCDTPLSLLEKKIDYHYRRHQLEHPNYLIEKGYLKNFIVTPSAFSDDQFSIISAPFRDSMTNTTFWEHYHRGDFNHQ